ncbi:MAG: insulinase family protein, partial [Alphaproteobacteria bacterium]
MKFSTAFARALLAPVLLVLVTVLPALAADLPDLEIPYEKFRLKNGLTVIVHEDHKAPIVAVSVWYHVGSKNEPAGKSGFAHLFEHLMFNGSEHHDDEYFKPLEKVGVTDINGTTWLDRTNYFETVPKPALEMALFLESDRMGHLLGAIDQKKLDNQRGVVQNEKRQGENRPYGKVFDEIQSALYPEGHPYHHTTIGSMEDLNAASLEDVKSWFQQYYGPNNAVLVLAGDISVKEGRALAEKYFGDIPPGPPLVHPKAEIPQHASDTRIIMQDRVPQARIYRAWAVPGRTERATDLLDVAGVVLGSGKTSRLYRDLVHDRQLATGVSAGVQPFELSSMFMIRVDVRP